MLSEQAKAALERIRLLVTGTQAHEIYKPGQPLDTLRNHDFAKNVHRDTYDIAYEMLRLFPVHTLNGMVIRWDDEITPEKLVASGFDVSEFNNTYLTSTSGLGVKLGTVLRWYAPWEDQFSIWSELAPTNMVEAWNLMAKCGCLVGGGE